MFVEKKTKPAILPAIRFWNREFGATWLSFERKRILEFKHVKPNEKVSISGYVKWITSSMFSLVPTLFSNQIYLLCRDCSNERPLENSYVTVSGETRFEKLRAVTPDSTKYNGVLVLQAYDWILSKPDIDIPNPNLTYDNFKTDLTARIEGLEPQIRDFLAFSAVSSPMFYQNTGGINLTMYDSTKAGLPKLVVREIRKVIPEDMGELHTIRTDFGSFAMRYKYAFVTGDADLPLTRQEENLLNHNASKLMPECTETSLSMFSAKDKPATIEDPPCRLSDAPIVIPEDTSINRRKENIDQFDALNFIVINHMKNPTINDYENSMTNIVGKLEKLTNDFDLDPNHLTKFGFLNASYNAKPTAIMRESLSFARAQNINTVTIDVVSRVFEDYFKWNFEYVYEIWEDLLTQPLIGGEQVASLRVKYREIVRIIRKYHSSKLPGVRKEDIIAECKTNPVETNQLLSECLNAGIIYEPLPGYYKLTSGNA
jgi:hypothetical protein